MGRILAVASQKGGVGKTTSVFNLSFALSRQGVRVLMVDGDPQGGLSLATNVRHRAKGGLVDLLRQKLTAEDAVTLTRDGTLGMVAMGAAEPDDVAFLEQAAHGLALRRAIRELAAGFDYVIIDVPGGVGALPRGLLAASDAVVGTLCLRALAVRSLPAFLKAFQGASAHSDRSLRLSGLLVTMADLGKPAEVDLLNQLKASLPEGTLFDTVIPFDERLEQATLKSIPVAMLSGANGAARPFLELAMELRNREENLSGGSGDADEAGIF